MIPASGGADGGIGWVGIMTLYLLTWLLLQGDPRYDLPQRVKMPFLVLGCLALMAFSLRHLIDPLAEALLLGALTITWPLCLPPVLTAIAKR